MKPFLCIDLTHDKNNEISNGEEFLVARPSPESTKALETNFENVIDTIDKNEFPFWLSIIEYLCGIASLLVVGVFTVIIVESGYFSLSEIYQTVPLLFWVCGVCLIIWSSLLIYKKIREKRIAEIDKNDRTFSKLEAYSKTILFELGVPETSKEVDILFFRYKTKNNKKVYDNGMQISTHINVAFNVFTDSDTIYFANLDGKYAFPLSSLKSIKTVKKTISIIDWNKTEKFNEGIYKQYKLCMNNFGSINCKYYHILELDVGWDILGIYIPCYELPIIEEITGLKAEEI